MITNWENAISKTLGQLNKIIKEKIWDIQRNIEEEEKWVLKREELVKETRENRINSKYNIMYIMNEVR